MKICKWIPGQTGLDNLGKPFSERPFLFEQNEPGNLRDTGLLQKGTNQSDW